MKLTTLIVLAVLVLFASFSTHGKRDHPMAGASQGTDTTRYNGLKKMAYAVTYGRREERAVACRSHRSTGC